LISNLERFIKLDSLEKLVLLLEFQADLHVIVASLIKLLHEVNLQIMNGKKHPETYDRSKQIIVKSMVDCSYRAVLCLKSRMPEWKRIVQGEKLRRDTMNLFVDLSGKLKIIQKKFRCFLKHGEKGGFFIH
jgi:hypothetical protein